MKVSKDENVNQQVKAILTDSNDFWFYNETRDEWLFFDTHAGTIDTAYTQYPDDILEDDPSMIPIYAGESFVITVRSPKRKIKENGKN